MLSQLLGLRHDLGDLHCLRPRLLPLEFELSPMPFFLLSLLLVLDLPQLSARSLSQRGFLSRLQFQLFPLRDFSLQLRRLQRGPLPQRLFLSLLHQRLSLLHFVGRVSLLWVGVLSQRLFLRPLLFGRSELPPLRRVGLLGVRRRLLARWGCLCLLRSAAAGLSGLRRFELSPLSKGALSVCGQLSSLRLSVSHLLWRLTLPQLSGRPFPRHHQQFL